MISCSLECYDFAMPAVDPTAFRNFFWTAQLTAGLAMAAKGFMEGVKGEPLYMGLLGALMGFAFTAPFSALAAWAKTAYDRRRARRLLEQPAQTERMPRQSPSALSPASSPPAAAASALPGPESPR